ncbi:MAG: GWxTD domain-containing protein, partial [Bacteroidetes bacterium]|nr:GWxTD domain-containing protein [Bacteroidota bacterium]
KRETAKEVIAILGEFDINDLPSGNYNLVIEIRDKENTRITSNQLFFQRSNPKVEYNLSDLAALSIENTFAGRITSEDTLNQYIMFLSPIATDLERGFINKQMKTSDLVTKQRFFLNFWITRDNLNPDKAWEYYLGQVMKVNHSFNAIARQGYDTDRGRVYLKYGPPNIISQSYNEPAAYPYEIWQYYTLGNNQRNKKFVFYTEDIVTNEFQLVHSDAIGEISNYRWQVMIYRRTYDPENLDQGQYFDAWGSKVNQYYDNPY